MLPARWMLRLVRIAAWLFGLSALFILFFYSPFYAKTMVYLLNQLMPVQVDQVAALSQQRAQLTEQDDFEPGSALWIARQAYLQSMEQALAQMQLAPLDLSADRFNDLKASSAPVVASATRITQSAAIADEAYPASQATADSSQVNLQYLLAIEARYQILQAQIRREQQQRQAKNVAKRLKDDLDKNNTTANLELDHTDTKRSLFPAGANTSADLTNRLPVESAPETVDDRSNTAAAQPQQSLSHSALYHSYWTFLQQHPVKLTGIDPQQSLTQIRQDMQLLKQLQAQPASKSSRPYAIVVLGGGLSLDPITQNIVINSYTRLRLETALSAHRLYRLPIVLSGVEAPYMQVWLKDHGIDAKLLENRSMNTCENSRFSALLLQKKGGAPTVLLVTDVYHMPRTRRLFALNGIETIPVVAPMPTALTAWQPSIQNYDHSRRANYELLASMRDMLVGSSDCREVP